MANQLIIFELSDLIRKHRHYLSPAPSVQQIVDNHHTSPDDLLAPSYYHPSITSWLSIQDLFNTLANLANLGEPTVQRHESSRPVQATSLLHSTHSRARTRIPRNPTIFTPPSCDCTSYPQMSPCWCTFSPFSASRVVGEENGVCVDGLSQIFGERVF